MYMCMGVNAGGWGGQRSDPLELELRWLGAGEMTEQLSAYSCRAPTWLTIIFNSNPRGSDTFFWPP